MNSIDLRSSQLAGSAVSPQAEHKGRQPQPARKIRSSNPATVAVWQCGHDQHAIAKIHDLLKAQLAKHVVDLNRCQDKDLPEDELDLQQPGTSAAEAVATGNPYNMISSC